jgi:hypothetical protein
MFQEHNSKSQILGETKIHRFLQDFQFGGFLFSFHLHISIARKQQFKRKCSKTKLRLKQQAQPTPNLLYQYFNTSRLTFQSFVHSV